MRIAFGWVVPKTEIRPAVSRKPAPQPVDTVTIRFAGKDPKAIMRTALAIYLDAPAQVEPLRKALVSFITDRMLEAIPPGKNAFEIPPEEIFDAEEDAWADIRAAVTQAAADGRSWDAPEEEDVEDAVMETLDWQKDDEMNETWEDYMSDRVWHESRKKGLLDFLYNADDQNDQAGDSPYQD